MRDTGSLAICHYYPRALDRRSGVTAAMAEWSAAQAAYGDRVAILSTDREGSPQQHYSAGVTVQAIPHHGRGRMTWVPRGLGRYLRQVDLLVLHEGWTPSNVLAAEASRRVGVPYVVVPHGVYEPAWVGMLRLHAIRALAERRVLSGAAGVHLFFDSERSQIARYAGETPCLVAPTGCRLPDHVWSGGGDYLLWVGRYSVKHKGLDRLLCALAYLSPSQRPQLIMRGVDEAGEQARVKKQAHQLGLDAWVQVGGPVYGAEKNALLLACAGYVQPSRWECHSIGLIEALSCSVPVLVSAAMHVAGDLQPRGAAVVVDPGEAALAGGLSALAEGLPEVGEAGRRYVMECLDWERVMESYQRQLRIVLAQPGATSRHSTKVERSHAHR